jgi:hypothetical protein
MMIALLEQNDVSHFSGRNYVSGIVDVPLT